MDIELLEALALSEDREQALEALIAGTEDHYFYRCLQLQLSARFEEVEPLAKAWIKQHGRTPKVIETERRQALLRYDDDPVEVARYLKKQLNLTFEHRKRQRSDEVAHPSRLDPSAISRQAFMTEALRRYPRTLEGFSEHATRWLLERDLDPELRRKLMERLRRPDHPRVLDLVLEDLDDERSAAFGSKAIHAQLLDDQLSALAKRRPRLERSEAFVRARVVKLWPSTDVDWEGDAAEHRAYLDRLWGYVRELPPQFNGLRAHVLHHLLDWGRRHGDYDRKAFLDYLAIPKRTSYANEDFLRIPQNREHIARLGIDYRATTRLPLVRDDSELVDDYLAHFFVTDDTYDAYLLFVNERHLKRLFALTKITRGVGDVERWYAVLDDPAALSAFKDAVAIRLLPENPRHLRATDPLRIVADVKHVSTLVVKVFEINALNHFLAHGREVDTSVDLDGLVAGHEEQHDYDDPPYRTVRRELTFAGFDRPGTFVIELIGNGKSSRALIRKGSLRVIERRGAAGHVFVVLNEENEPLPDAEIWFGGRVHRPDTEGCITLPYGEEPKRAQMLLRHGNVTTLESFEHQAETYNLSAAMFADREQLKSGTDAQLVVRAGVFLNDVPVSLALLEDVKLTLRSTDRFSVSSEKEVDDLELAADRETVCPFRVPEDLAELDIELSARVRRVTTGKEIVLRAQQHMAINGIERTDHTEALLLSSTADGWVVSLLGKSGEPRPHQIVNLGLSHRLFTIEARVALQTDEAGRIELGELDEITWLAAEAPSGAQARWRLSKDGGRFPHVVHLREGESAAIPHIGPESGHVSLLERRGGSFQRDWSSSATIERGYIVVSPLPAGDYELFNEAYGPPITLRVNKGARCGRWLVSSARYLETRGQITVNVSDITTRDDALSIRLAGTTKGTRVHVFGRRFASPVSPGQALAAFTLPPPACVYQVRVRSHYVSGRDIGDEYRYVLERGLRKKFAGNMLGRPGLLLNPWAVRKTDTSTDVPIGGGAFGASAPQAGRALAADALEQGERAAGGVDHANVDFLARPGAALLNLRPEGDVVEVPLEALAGMTSICVVAVDGHVVWREFALPEEPVRHARRALDLALDAEGHFTEQRQTTALMSGERLVIDDVATSSVKTIDSLPAAHRLLRTLANDDRHTSRGLDDLDFALRWPSLSDEEKADEYSAHACHEIHLFLHRRDRPFFDRVVRPYLQSKLHKTFLDHYLLEDDLGRFLEPWRYGRLNTMEQLLLGRRLGLDSVARSIRDRFDLLEEDPDAEAHRFNTALGGGALDSGGPEGGGGAGDALGFAQAKAKAVAVRSRKRSAGPPGPPPPRAARAPMPPGPPGMAAPPPAMAPMAAPAPAPMAAVDTPAELYSLSELARSEGGGFDGFADDDLSRRDEMTPLFRKTDATEELAENNYYRLRLHDQGPDLIGVNAFWRDFAEHEGEGPFVSKHLAHAAGSCAEIMCALALTDLPWTPGEPAVTYERSRMELRADTPMVVLHKEIKPTEPIDDGVPLLVSQNYFRKDDRYVYDGNTQIEKYVTGELLTHVVYVCQVVVTNPTSARQRLELLLQIPKGAIPVADGFVSKGRNIELGAYGTVAIEYAFYFPEAGSFPHFPAHVSKNEGLVAAAPPTMLTVVNRLTTRDTTSWTYVSQEADDDGVIQFLEQENIERLDLSLMAWRMHDPAFFDRATKLLASRHVYDDTLWSYAIAHGRRERIAEYLRHRDAFLRSAGMAVRGRFLSFDPIERWWHEHLEYLPLIHARAHRLGRKTKILNAAFDAQYRRFLTTMAYAPTPTGDELLVAATYMFLQDRVDDALGMLERAETGTITATLQHDYLRCYAAFYEEELETAAEIAARHIAHPVPRWRKRFELVAAHIAEAQHVHTTTSPIDDEDRAQRQDALASRAPHLELEVEGHEISLRYENLDRCTVSYFPMDIELLFSRQPFVAQDSERFGLIAPRRRDEIELPAGGSHTFELPEELRSTNVIVEAAGGGIRRSVANYANDLAVQVVETYGQVRVRHRATSQPMSKVYVKVFAREHGGAVRFFKDGYTDVRGYFDYASLSTDELDSVKRFAILATSEDAGAVIREALPPQR